MSVPWKICNSELHYHIRWSSSDSLDWQGFETPEEAEASAHTIVRRNETYTIEARSGNCERCDQLVERALTKKNGR